MHHPTRQLLMSIDMNRLLRHTFYPGVSLCVSGCAQFSPPSLCSRPVMVSPTPAGRTKKDKKKKTAQHVFLRSLLTGKPSYLLRKISSVHSSVTNVQVDGKMPTLCTLFTPENQLSHAIY